MAVKEAADLIFAQASGGGEDGFADAARGGIDGSGVKEEGGAFLAVAPHGQGGVEMGDFDLRAAIEGGVDSAEAEDLVKSVPRSSNGGSLALGRFRPSPKKTRPRKGSPAAPIT